MLGIIRDREGLIEAIKGVVARFSGIRLAYLFGSYAEGRAMPASDLDVAIVADSPRTLAKFHVAIAEELGISWERISILDLSRAPPILMVKVLKQGVRITGDEAEARRLLEAIPLDTLEVVELERLDFYEWLADVNPIDENLIKSIVVQVEGDIEYLRRMLSARRIEDIVGSEDLRRAFERATHTAIEGILDMLRHAISGFNLGIAERYRDYVELAGRAGVISRDISEGLSTLVDFRHRLVHRYRGLDYGKLWSYAETLVNLWPAVHKEFKDFLKDKLKM